MEKRETGMAGMEMRLIMAPVLALVQTVATTASGQSPPPGPVAPFYYGTGMMGGWGPGYYGPGMMGGFWPFSGIVVLLALHPRLVPGWPSQRRNLNGLKPPCKPSP